MDVLGASNYTINGNIRTAVAGNTETTIAGAKRNLEKSGTGTLTLNGTNYFENGIILSGGRIIAETAKSVDVGAASAVTMTNFSTLEFSTVAGTTETYDKLITGDNGDLEKTGGGTLTLSATNIPYAVIIL